MHPDISHLRGMSEPFFFSFDTLPNQRLVGHAVIFSSFELAGNDTRVKLCTPDDDVRMQRFLHFTIENYGKIAKDALKATIQERAQQLDQLERQIATLKKQLQQLKQKAS